MKYIRNSAAGPPVRGERGVHGDAPHAGVIMIGKEQGLKPYQPNQRIRPP
jgi:hypothetical protein